MLATPAHFLFAHAEFERSDPVGGAIVEGDLQEVRLMFSEPILDANLFVLTGTTEVTPQSMTVDTTEAIAAFAEPFAVGTYQVVWTAQSDDDHRISGSFSFEVTASSGIPWIIIGGIVILLSGGIIIARMLAPKQSKEESTTTL